MIQRIQSLYLLLATAGCIALYFLPVASLSSTGGEYVFYLEGLKEGSQLYARTTLLPILCGMLSVFFMIILFLFRKRILQIRLSAIAILAYIIFIGAIFYYSDRLGKMLEGIMIYETSAYISLVPLVLLILAHRAIRRDEKMVRSADRLR